MEPKPAFEPAATPRSQALFAMNPDPVLELDRDGRFVRINRAGTELTGYSETELAGQPFESIVAPQHVPAARRHFAEAIDGVPSRFELRCRGRDGAMFDLAVTNIPIVRDDAVDGVYSVVSDISERKRRETYIRLAANALDNMAEGILITDAERKIVWVNPAFTAITGYSLRDTVGRRPRLMDSSADGVATYSDAARAAAETGHWQGEIVCRRKNGQLFTCVVSLSAVREHGEIANYVDVLTDISTLKNYQSRVDFLVSHDPLTQLPARSLFEHDVTVAIEQARAESKSMAIVVIGLDSFKLINDSLGRQTGDTALRQIAKRIADNVRDIDIVARLGSDQFAVMLADMEEPGNIGIAVNNLFKKLAEPFVVHGHQLFFSASAGIGCFPKDGEDAATLLKNAEAAMYLAKQRGRNTYQFYDRRINRKVHDRLRIANNLRRAVQRGEFELYYQPSLSLADGNIIGAEALLRWQHPRLGLVLPNYFIGLAEDSGLIRTLGGWALETACRQAVEWEQQGYPSLRVAVNLSAFQFRQPDIVRQIQTTIDQTGIAPQCLELEITESTIMDDPALNRRVINQLNDIGVTIAIDDFGTGYSSLAYLRDLPVNCLKIDRSFVAGIPNDKQQTAIIRAIISMAKTLGKRIIAEGIETGTQLQFLRREGCDEGQGFLIGRPCPAERLQTFLRERDPIANYGNI